MNRRSLLQGASVSLATSAAVTLPPLARANSPQERSGAVAARGDTVVARAGQATVEIATGRIAGSVRNGVFSFKGLPYGDTTEGDNRFCPPRKPTPWAGIRSSRQYGFVCPQDKGTGRQNDEEAFMFQWNDSVEGEDCLRLNVWTPGINDNKKRPVMVWLHGGAFTAGSGHDLPAFDGENLARRGDVVVVTLNHRLNLLGFLDLSKYSDKYAESGNVGMLDIVQALQWVRENIAVLGGDPGCVLIFGQSGGGAKVSTLMGMPAAQGLWITCAPVRAAAIAQARSKAALQKAPAYLYWFTWQTPIFDGRPRAFHCAELPFVFHNTDRCDTMTGGGPRARALAGRVADAWIQFARTGNPSHAGLPRWAPFDATSVPTMILDDEPLLVRNPDGDELAALGGTV